MLPPIFKGKLIRLAAPLPEDDAIIAKWTENEDYLRLLDTDPARPLSPQRINELEKEFAKSERVFLFRIRTLEDDKLIGFTDVEVSWSHQTAWLAIAIDPAYWNSGYGTDAMRVILRYGFLELNLHRINLNVFDFNARARRVYEKVGFVQEGIQREALNRGGRRWDIVYYGILRSEWEAKQSES